MRWSAEVPEATLTRLGHGGVAVLDQLEALSHADELDVIGAVHGGEDQAAVLNSLAAVAVALERELPWLCNAEHGRHDSISHAHGREDVPGPQREEELTGDGLG